MEYVGVGMARVWLGRDDVIMCVLGYPCRQRWVRDGVTLSQAAEFCLDGADDGNGVRHAARFNDEVPDRQGRGGGGGEV